MYGFEEKYRRLRQQLLFGVIALFVLFVGGTLWYWLIEGWSWSDAAYMTIITLSTVGFGEVNPLEERSRLFTIGLILTGLITIGYIVNRFTEALIEGYFQEGIRLRQERQLIEKLKDHYILCGFGRTGRNVAEEFQAEGIPFVIIDSQANKVEKAKEQGYIIIQADATLDESLIRAKIETALCLVTALPSDAENLYIVISAKTLNPNIRVIARASTEEAVQKLTRGGAEVVVSPYVTGGKRLAAAALRPKVMDFVDGIITGTESSFYLEQCEIDEKVCSCVGQTLSEARLRSQSGALVLAIRRVDGNLIGGPTGETRILHKDLLICMGTAEQLSKLNRILDPTRIELPRRPKKPKNQP